MGWHQLVVQSLYHLLLLVEERCRCIEEGGLLKKGGLGINSIFFSLWINSWSLPAFNATVDGPLSISSLLSMLLDSTSMGSKKANHYLFRSSLVPSVRSQEKSGPKEDDVFLLLESPCLFFRWSVRSWQNFSRIIHTCSIVKYQGSWMYASYINTSCTYA